MTSLLSALLLFTPAGDLADPGSFYADGGIAMTPSDKGPLGVGWKSDVAIYPRRQRSPTMDIFYPSLADGSFDGSGGPYPVILFVQGGLVAVEDYFFLAAQFASWGVVTALAHYPRDLAIYAPDLTLAALDRLEASNEERSFWQGGLDLDRVGVGGHSLGGVVADLNVDVDPRFDALLMLDTVPGDENGAEFPGATLVVSGLDECGASNEDKYAGYNTYSAPRVYGGIAGMSHYQFTASDEEDAIDCPPDITLEAAHDHLSSIAVPFILTVLADDPTFFDYLTAPNEGIEVELDW